MKGICLEESTVDQEIIFTGKKFCWLLIRWQKLNSQKIFSGEQLVCTHVQYVYMCEYTVLK